MKIRPLGAELFHAEGLTHGQTWWSYMYMYEEPTKCTLFHQRFNMCISRCTVQRT